MLLWQSSMRFKREVWLSSFKDQAKTTVGDKQMLWWGRIEGLVCLHLALRLVLSKANFVEILEGIN